MAQAIQATPINVESWKLEYMSEGLVEKQNIFCLFWTNEFRGTLLRGQRSVLTRAVTSINVEGCNLKHMSFGRISKDFWKSSPASFWKSKQARSLNVYLCVCLSSSVVTTLINVGSYKLEYMSLGVVGKNGIFVFWKKKY